MIRVEPQVVGPKFDIVTKNDWTEAENQSGALAILDRLGFFLEVLPLVSKCFRQCSQWNAIFLERIPFLNLRQSNKMTPEGKFLRGIVSTTTQTCFVWPSWLTQGTKSSPTPSPLSACRNWISSPALMTFWLFSRQHFKWLILELRILLKSVTCVFLGWERFAANPLKSDLLCGQRVF